MKLIRCEVLGFGKLRNLKYDFTSGMNTLCYENGWGKSTLMSFIKVMLYGFDGEGRRNDLDNERKRYYPWQGGTFGGKLYIEVSGRKYLITRIFDKNKKANDTFELRCCDTNDICTDFSENIGEEIFGIDSASFARTVIWLQGSSETGVTGSISAKLGGLIDDAADINNFESANLRLKKILDSLTPDRATGKLSRLSSKAQDIKQRIISLKGSGESANEITENINLLKAERKEIFKKLSLYEELINEGERRSENSGGGNKRGIAAAVVLIIIGCALLGINFLLSDLPFAFILPVTGAALIAISLIIIAILVRRAGRRNKPSGRGGELNIKIRKLSSRLEEIAYQIKDYEYILEHYEERQLEIIHENENLEGVLNEIDELKKKYEIIKKTQKYLEKARDSFNLKYTGPLLLGFKKYYRKLTGEDALEFSMDSGANILAEQEGLNRSPYQLSKGYQDAIYFCMRMALIDAMYDTEKPFIMLDDPFVNLDDDKAARAEQLINIISEQYQVLYFTCHG